MLGTRHCGLFFFSLVLAAVLPACDYQIDAPLVNRVDNSPVHNFPNTQVGEALETHLKKALAIGPEAEDEYQKSLSLLRARAEDVLPVLDQVYRNTEEGTFDDG